jgi:hypothetical protein
MVIPFTTVYWRKECTILRVQRQSIPSHETIDSDSRHIGQGCSGTYSRYANPCTAELLHQRADGSIGVGLQLYHRHNTKSCMI